MYNYTRNIINNSQFSFFLRQLRTKICLHWISYTQSVIPYAKLMFLCLKNSLNAKPIPLIPCFKIPA